MKIYGDYTFVLDKLNVKNHSHIKAGGNGLKIVEFADKFIEEQKLISQDKAVISHEGMNYIRNQLADMESGAQFEAGDGRNLSLITGKDMSLMDGLCETYISQRLDVVDEEGISRNLYRDLNTWYRYGMMDRDKEDWGDHADSLVNAYEARYKWIVEGYKNGTREVWVQDYSTGEEFSGVELELDGQPVRYRKLTREEELEMLDKAFDKLVQDKAEKFVMDAEARRLEKEQKEKGETEETNSEDEMWQAFEMIVDELVKEARVLLDRVKQELEELLKQEEPEIDFEGRMEIEAHNHRLETEARGKQQSQYANYKKMSRMASDMQTLLKNVRA